MRGAGLSGGRERGPVECRDGPGCGQGSAGALGAPATVTRRAPPEQDGAHGPGGAGLRAVPAVVTGEGERRQQAGPVPRSRAVPRPGGRPVGPARRGRARCPTRTWATCSRRARGSGCCDQLGVPDWVAQRLWWGTISLAAVLGARWLFRQLGTGPTGALAGALVYVLTPYQLAFTARISVLLLPWAALPWLVGLTMRATRSRGLAAARPHRRRPAAGRGHERLLPAPRRGRTAAVAGAGAGSTHGKPAQVVAAAARVALLSVGRLGLVAGRGAHPGPIRPAGAAAHRERARRSPTRRARATCCAASATGSSTAATARATRIDQAADYAVQQHRRGPQLRGAGRGPGGRAARALDPPGLLRAARGRGHRHRCRRLAGRRLRAPTARCGSASPATRRSGWRSATAPGSCPSSSSAWPVCWPRRSARCRPLPWRRLGGAAVAVLAARGPASGGAGRVPLRRRGPTRGAPRVLDEATAEAMDAGDHSTRVLEIPGSSFAAYRWGNTVDPITPSLIDRPYLAREVLPSGTAGTADLLAALDRRMQLGVFEPAALAPIARLLRGRHRRPAGRPRAGGALRHATAVRAVARPHLTGARRPRAAAHVRAPRRRRRGARPALGGVVRRAAGLGPSCGRRRRLGRWCWPATATASSTRQPRDSLDGSVARALRAGRSTTTPSLVRSTPGAHLVLTDTYRRRIQTWFYSLRDTRGPTEQAGEIAPDPTGYDFRLDPFPGATDDARTVVEQVGGRATASMAGGPERPEDRAAHAVDDDVTTAWRVGGADPSGQTLTIVVGSAGRDRRAAPRPSRRPRRGPHPGPGGRTGRRRRADPRRPGSRVLHGRGPGRAAAGGPGGRGGGRGARDGTRDDTAPPVLTGRPGRGAPRVLHAGRAGAAARRPAGAGRCRPGRPRPRHRPHPAAPVPAQAKTAGTTRPTSTAASTCRSPARSPSQQWPALSAAART